MPLNPLDGHLNLFAEMIRRMKGNALKYNTINIFRLIKKSCQRGFIFKNRWFIYKGRYDLYKMVYLERRETIFKVKVKR